MTKILSAMNSFLWGAPSLILILSVGLYLSMRLGFVQLRLLPKALKLFFRQFLPGKREKAGVSPFRALCTALGATVGTGNLVGVAGAICLGGPGAIFWLWVCGVLGMVTKYAEAVLAVRYRIRSETGYVGGPMYVMLLGLGKKWKLMASAYCIFGCLAALGVGTAAQVNAVVTGIRGVLAQFHCSWNLPVLTVGLLLSAGMGVLLFGGAKRIGAAAECLVPFAAAGYILLCLGFLVVHASKIPTAFSMILQGASDPRAVTGGMLGSSFQALRVGCSRGVFTNEAGMGTAAIAHGAAEVSHPAEQGLMGIVEVFLDTLVICTLTALVILVSGVPVPYGLDQGAELTIRAFSNVYGAFAPIVITAFLCLFAIATILGWGLYGGRCAQFLFGHSRWKPFAAAQCVAIVAGAVIEAPAVWQFSEMVNGLMVIPNLITLAALTPELQRLTKEYRKSGGRTAGGGNYADFHQCKPL